MTTFQECVMQRYATKRFDGRAVPEETIRELLELVRFAPSALNLQPWRIKVVTDPATKERLLPAAFDQPQVTTCSHLLVFCADPDYAGLIRKLDGLLRKNGVPDEMRETVIGMCRQFTGPMTPEQRLSWSAAQTYLALGNALNGAKALGLDSCPMGGFDPAAVSTVLGIPAPLVPVMLCPVGYAADQQGPKLRHSLEELLL
ncbi:MAG: nitroreductase family protein [Methanospirillum sp.]